MLRFDNVDTITDLERHWRTTLYTLEDGDPRKRILEVLLDSCECANCERLKEGAFDPARFGERSDTLQRLDYESANAVVVVEIKKTANGNNGGKWITPERRLAIYLRDDFRCCYCGEDLSESDRFHVSLDHLVPRSKQGTNDSNNLVTACRSCNSARQDRKWYEYATGGAVERIKRQRRRKVNVELAKQVISGEVPLVEVLTKQWEAKSK